jgi:ABC-type sugar transport system ATPase subunit
VADVKIEHLNKSYGSAEILKDISMTVKDGSFVVLVGPSGCGKSTLLRTIAGLEPINGGNIAIGNRDVSALPPAKREIAMVFQSYALYPHMNVENNMGFGLKFAGVPKAEIATRVMEAARILKLEPLLRRRPRDLSGGQRQRVAIGRAIVRKPQVFLFDEPLSNLDAALRVNTRIEIAKLHKLLKATIIYVTHDQVEAMTLADQIVVMNEGRVEQAGRPLDLYYRPANLFVAGFIGSPAMNFIPSTVVDASTVVFESGQRLTVPLPLTCSTGDKLTLGLRPEHLIVGKPGISGDIDIVERLGETGFAHVTVGSGQTVIAEVRGESGLRSGDRVSLGFQDINLHFFDGQGAALIFGASV